MPEGPILHRFAREQNRDLADRRVRATAVQHRFAREARRLDGKVFLRAEARGKHLFHHWRDGSIVHVHLGMFGDFTRHPSPPPHPRATVRLRLSTPTATWDLIGPPTCELVDPQKRRQILDRLGPDPIVARSGGEEFVRRLGRTDRPIGQALLDQRIVAGVGNIYRAELLFLTGIHPLRTSSSLSDSDAKNLWEASRRLLIRGTREERIWTIDRRERATAQERRFYVYGQEICLRCGSRVRSFPLSGRTMYACIRCQPRTRSARGTIQRL